MPSVLPRVAIALVAILMLAWSVVLWRDQVIGGAAEDRIFGNPRLTDADWQRTLDDFKSAELLDPGTEWDVTRAGALILKGDRAESAAITEDVLEDEPDNLQAWVVLRKATEGRDRERFAEAEAQIRRLNPPTSAP